LVISSDVAGIGAIYGLPFARLLMAVVFLYSGQDTLRHWRAGVAEFAELGIPFSGLFAAATIATQLLGGLSVATGVGAAFGAALLAGFTIAATVLGHRFWLMRGDAAKREFTTSLEHVAIVGGLILVIVDSLRTG
jgi:uncharacterized membrane protein YphA (DoxX/SURF4 family)